MRPSVEEAVEELDRVADVLRTAADEQLDAGGMSDALYDLRLQRRRVAMWTLDGRERRDIDAAYDRLETALRNRMGD